MIEKDFEQWKENYSYLDLGAELLSLTDFAQKNSEKWFFALQGALAKRNREAKIAKERGWKPLDAALIAFKLGQGGGVDKDRIDQFQLALDTVEAGGDECAKGEVGIRGVIARF